MTVNQQIAQAPTARSFGHFWPALCRPALRRARHLLTYHASLTALAPVHATSGHQLRRVPAIDDLASSTCRPCVLGLLAPPVLHLPSPLTSSHCHRLCAVSSSYPSCQSLDRTKPTSTARTLYTTHNPQASFFFSFASRAQLRDQRASLVHPCVIPPSLECLQATRLPHRTFFLHSDECLRPQPANSGSITTS